MENCTLQDIIRVAEQKLKSEEMSPAKKIEVQQIHDVVNLLANAPYSEIRGMLRISIIEDPDADPEIKDMPEEAGHILFGKWEGFSVRYYIDYSTLYDRLYGEYVTEEFASQWGVGEERLREDALRNLESLEKHLYGMRTDSYLLKSLFRLEYGSRRTKAFYGNGIIMSPLMQKKIFSKFGPYYAYPICESYTYIISREALEKLGIQPKDFVFKLEDLFLKGDRVFCKKSLYFGDSGSNG